MRKQKPDLRPDWRDPNMPVMRDYVMSNGERKTVVDQDYERCYREYMMQASPHPTYDSDPTYNMRRTK